MFVSEWALGSTAGAEALSVRRAVFVEELGLPKETVFDSQDLYAAHLVIRLAGTPIASGRMRPIEDGVCLDRLCVKKEHRGERFFDLMVRLMLKKAQDMGTPRVQVETVAAHAAYFTAFGFRPQTDEQPYDRQSPDTTLLLFLNPEEIDWHPSCKDAL